MRFVAIRAAWAALSIAAPASSAPASDAPPDSTVLEVVGVVRAERKPIGGALVFLEGTRRDAAQVDHDGRFRFRVVLPGPDGLVRAPAAMWLDARHPGHRITLAGGAPRLKLELRAFDDSSGARHVSIRSNDRDITAALARALSDSIRPDTLRVRFAGVPGTPAPPADVAMNQLADVVVRAGRGPQSAEPGAAAGADSAAADTSARAARTPAPAAAAARDTCACRVEGTVEVQWDRPLPSRVPIALWLEGQPSERDSIELELGSPRAFVLEARHCGTSRVQYITYSKTRFELRSPLPVFECRGRRTSQVRIVLRPTGVLP